MKYYVYEREPRMNAKPDSIILGPYVSAKAADEARVQFGFSDENYYVAPEPYIPNSGIPF